MATPTSDSAFRILGIAGSLRARSYNKSLLRAAIELAPETLSIEIFDRLGEIPLFSEDIEAAGDPEPVAALKGAIRRSDALLIVTPEYNYGIPGVLKNAIDWASRPPGNCVLNEKPAALMGATPGLGGTARSQLALRQAFVFTRTYALAQPEILVARADQKFGSDGKLNDETTRKWVRSLLVALEQWTAKFKGTQTLVA